MYSIRPATLEDAGIIATHRQRMFEDIGGHNQQKLQSMTENFRPWLESRMASGEYLGWLAMASDGMVAAGLGLWLMDWPPHVLGAGARRGNIVNVYTEPRHRRRGLARLLMNAALACCRANCVNVVILHASKDGQRLYDSMGFKPTNEMRLVLD